MSRFFVFSFSFCVALCVAAPSYAQTTSTTPAVVPTILRMGDGRFYHPASGLIGNSREDLLARIEAALHPVATPVEPVLTPPPTFPPPHPSSSDQAPRVVLAARRGRSLLLADVVTMRILKTKPSSFKEVVLAVWNSNTDEVRLVPIKTDGRSVEVVSSDLVIRLRGGHGYDTDYAVVPPENIVVGVRYPMIQEVKARKKATYHLRDFVYAPYGASVHTNEVVRWGKVVLDQMVDRALADIRSKGVKSKAFSGRFLADVADPVALKSIMAIEHLDHGSVGRGADDRLALFYVELGLNEDAAFHQDVSSAGAQGLLQFIPSTYGSMVKHWPGLGLIQDFGEGMANPLNAIKAQVAYLDEVWSDLPAEAKDSRITSPDNMRAYLVAAYNTGGVRVRRAIHRFGEAWDRDYRKEWDELDAKQTGLASEIHQLKKKLKTEKQPKMKKKWTLELERSRRRYADATDELETLDHSRLKAETLGYLLKYHLVAPRMKFSEVALR